jgi:hypothetical protein
MRRPPCPAAFPTASAARFSLLASARTEPAQPLRIRRNTFSISTDYSFARSASHQTRRRFKSSIYLFTDHSFGFGSGAVATPHQFHHPQRYNAICLGCQHHQRTEHPRIGRAWFEKGNSVHLTTTFRSGMAEKLVPHPGKSFSSSKTSARPFSSRRCRLKPWPLARRAHAANMAIRDFHWRSAGATFAQSLRKRREPNLPKR